MKKRMIVLGTVLAFAISGGSFAVAGESMGTEDAAGKILRCMPSPSVAALVAGKTVDARISGYGWGESADTLSLDFTVTEPVIFAAAEIDELETGDIIRTGMEDYTVRSVEEKDGTIVVIPEEEWLMPVTLTVNDDGCYQAENEDGVLIGDSFSFEGSLSPDLVYINEAGERLTAEELMNDLSEEVIDTFNIIPKVTFDEDGYLVELDFSE